MRTEVRMYCQLLVGFAAAVLAGGCLSVPIPQAEADPARFYVLNATSPAAPPATSETLGLSIVLQPVEVASYLRARPMIVRRGENEIQFREFARWGESLDLGIARVLREELLARGVKRVDFGVAGPGAKDALAVSIRVLACEGRTDGTIAFQAVWAAKELAGGAATAEGVLNAGEPRWNAKDEGTLAAALSQAIARLADDIVSRTKRG